jgi:hypothetical protein
VQLFGLARATWQMSATANDDTKVGRRRSMKVGRRRSMKTGENTDSRGIAMGIPSVTSAREFAQALVG